MFSALSGPFGPTLGAANSAGGSPPVITSPAFLAAGTVDTLYPTTTFTATGSTPIAWTSTALPAGMTFTTVSNQGVLAGTPTATSSGSITFTATNAYGSDGRALTLTVNAAGAGPVLVTAPSTSVFFAATASSGEVLGAVPGTYQYDDGVRFSGTVGAGDLISRPTSTTAVFYIGSAAGLSGTNDAYKDWYLFADGVAPYAAIGANSFYCGITAYDAATKRVTVMWGSTETPTTGGVWQLVRDYPVSRKGQWKRNGVAITGANTRAYAITPADIGQSIIYEETVGFVDPTFVQRADAQVLSPNPATSTTVSSSAYVSSASFSGTGKITSAADFDYLGSFLSPYGYSDAKLNVIPASQSQNGQVSLLLSDVSAANGYNEISIPALLTNANPTSLNTATITRTSGDIFNGWAYNAQTGNSASIIGGAYVLPGSSNMLAGNTGYYVYTTPNFFVKRPANITTAASVNPFCVYPSNQGNARWAGGSICEIPTALQGALGGDVLVSSGVLAIASNNSQTPAGMVFNSADVDAAVAKYETGTAQSGSTTTAILAVGASATNNYYLNWQVVFSIGGSTSGNGGRVTAYNGTTKQLTFTTIGAAVTAGSTYTLIAPVISKQLYGNTVPYEPESKEFPVLWNTVNSWNFCAFIPKGTTSVVNITNALIGQKQYGLWATYADANGQYWGGINIGKGRIVTAGVYGSVSPGPVDGSVWRNDNNNFCLFWVYDASSLAQVVSGSKTYNQIDPSAVFSFMLPYGGSSGSISAAFDNTNNRLYVYQLLSGSYGTNKLVHVYSCNKYV